MSIRNFKLLIKIGALTSKPYAFTARPWELKSVETFDVFDSFGSQIRVDIRGNDYVRVLPILNKNLNEQWITDRVRFNYDGLKRQRLGFPSLKKTFVDNEFPQYNNISWKEGLHSLSEFMLNSDTSIDLDLICGDLTDLETAIKISDFISMFSLGTVRCYSTYAGFNLNINYKEQYIANTLNIETFEDSYDCLLLLGVNLRLESPLLNLRIRKAVVENGLSVFSLGAIKFTNYHIENLGNSYNELLQLVEGRSTDSSILLKMKSIYSLFGASISQLPEFNQDIFLFLKDKISLKGVSPLVLGSAHTGLADFGVSSLRSISSECRLRGKRIIYILDSDDIYVNDKFYDMTIYQGHHGDYIAQKATVILPSLTPYEKSGEYRNFIGRLFSTSFILNPPVEALDDCEILNKISIGLIGPNAEYLKQAVSRPNILAGMQERKNKFISGKLGTPFLNMVKLPLVKVFNGIVQNYVNNYYMMDSISRASHVMALSSIRFQPKNYNFK